jgi:hypothetical protein
MLHLREKVLSACFSASDGAMYLGGAFEGAAPLDVGERFDALQHAVAAIFGDCSPCSGGGGCCFEIV